MEILLITNRVVVEIRLELLSGTSFNEARESPQSVWM